MQTLEKELGVQLFSREKHGFSLTSAGEYFYAHARGIVEDVEKLRMKTMEIGVEEIEDRGNVL